MSNADRPHEPLIPETGDMQDEQGSQVQRGLWKRASRGRFVYSQEKVDKADIRSLDRVWGRLEEHVTRNNTAYEDNKNIPALSGTRPTISSFETKQGYSAQHTRQAFQHRLGNVAALFFVIVLVGSLLLVLQVVQHANTTTGAHSNMQATPASPKITIRDKQAIGIITEKNGAAQFSSAKAVLPVEGAVIWQNQTSIPQVVLSENSGQGIKLILKESKAVIFYQAGTCLFHLQSNPTVVVAIIVGKNAPSSGTSTCAFRVENVAG